MNASSTLFFDSLNSTAGASSTSSISLTFGCLNGLSSSEEDKESLVLVASESFFDFPRLEEAFFERLLLVDEASESLGRFDFSLLLSVFGVEFVSFFGEGIESRSLFVG